MLGVQVPIVIEKREPTESLTLRAPSWLIEALDEIAKAERTSRSGVGVSLLKVGLEAWRAEQKKPRR